MRTLMKPPTRRPRPSRRGLTLTESLLVLGLAALLASVAYVTYGAARKDTRLSELTNGTLTLVGKIGQVYGSSSDYTSLTPQLLAQSKLVPASFRVVDLNGRPELRDLFGNPVTLTGTLGSYALTFDNLDTESCMKLAPPLAAVAHRIHAGSAAEINATAGVVTGGQIYKDPHGAVDVARLAQGCSVAPARLALEIRT